MLKSFKSLHQIRHAENRQKTQKAQKDKKTSFQKETVENADFYKPVLNKVMTTFKGTNYKSIEDNVNFLLKISVKISFFFQGFNGMPYETTSRTYLRRLLNTIGTDVPVFLRFLRFWLNSRKQILAKYSLR